MSTTKEINLNQYLTIFLAYKNTVIVLVLCAILISAFIYKESPELYFSKTSVNFEFFNPNNPLASAGGNFAITSDEEAYINTQIDLVESRLVAEKVFNGLSDAQKERLEISFFEGKSLIDVYVDSLLDGVEVLIEKFSNPNEEDLFLEESGTVSEKVIKNVRNDRKGLDSTPWKAIAMLSDLSVENVFGTRIVEIGYSSVDRELAALIASRFAVAYIDTNLRFLRDPAEGSKEWLEGQLQVLKADLESAQDNLTKYKADKGIVVSAERVDLESTKLQRMNDELVVVQNDLRQAEVTRRQLDDVKKEGKSLLSLSAISDSAEIRAIRLEIRTLEGEVAEKSSELGDNHPLLRQLKQELSEANSKLRRELSTLTNVIVNQEGLLREKNESLGKSIATQKRIVLGLQKEFDQISVYQSEIDRSRQAYEAALKRSNDAELEVTVDKTNVKIIDKARVPRSPYSPEITEILIFALAGAFALSLFIVLVAEFFWRKIRSVEDIVQDLDMKVLGVLPK